MAKSESQLLAGLIIAAGDTLEVFSDTNWRDHFPKWKADKIERALAKLAKGIALAEYGPMKPYWRFSDHCRGAQGI